MGGPEELDEREVPLGDTSLDAMVEAELQGRPVGRRPRWRHLVLVGLLLPAVVALLVGLAQARTTGKVPTDATLVLVIDVSGSMNAEDVHPTRMAAAQRAAHELFSALPSQMRIAIIAFSNEAKVVEEPSLDRGELGRAIDDLSAGGGTAMGDALMAALDMVRPGEAPADTGSSPPSTASALGPAPPAERPPASILLLSDGVNTLGQAHPFEASQLASQLDVPIYAVALGTPDGKALIPDGGGGHRLQAVPPDRLTLDVLASATYGRFYKATTADELSRVYHDIGARVTRRDERRKAVYWPTGTGVALLVLTAALGGAWRRKLSQAAA